MDAVRERYFDNCTLYYTHLCHEQNTACVVVSMSDHTSNEIVTHICSEQIKKQ